MRKNILIFCHHHATQFIDVCNQYVSLFDPEKYHVTVAYLCGEPDEAIRKRSASEEVIFLDQSRKSIRGLKLGALWKLFRLCREKKYSIVICHRYKPVYLMMWVAQVCRIPTLFFIMHDVGTFSARVRRLMTRWLARKNMYFAGVSDAVRNDMYVDLQGIIPAERVITLYNCIDMRAAKETLVSRNAARNFFGLPEAGFVFGTLARLEPVKDLPCMIKAFANIQKSCPDALLLIAGEGMLLESLQNLTHELGVSDRVYFSGFVPEAWRYLAAFDVFLLTSLREAFGRVLPEAMTARIPVIGVRSGGIPEVIGEAGLVLEPRNHEALAAAMLRYYQMTPEARSQWGDKGYQHIEKNFSLPRFNQIFWAIHDKN